MKNSIRMSSFEYHQFLKSILEIRFNYICRPITTLLELIYKDEKEQSLVDIQQTMEYFDEYNYLLEGVSDWYENNLDKNFLSKEEFKDLIKEIDEDYVYNIDLEAFLKLIKNLYKVFSFDGLLDEETEDLPIEALIIFFSEKGITPILNLLESEFEKNVITLSYPKVEELISDLLSSKVEVEEDFEEENEVETESLDAFEELEYFGEDDLEHTDDNDVEKLEELLSSEEDEETENADDFEELEYFGKEDSEENADDNDVEKLEELISSEEDEETESSDDFEELEYFGEDDLEDTDDNDVEKLEELLSSVEDEETESVDAFEELEYFGDDDLEESDSLDLDDFLLDDEELNDNNKSE